MYIVGCRTIQDEHGHSLFENLAHFPPDDPDIELAKRTLILCWQAEDSVCFSDFADRSRWAAFKKALAEARGGTHE